MSPVQPIASFLIPVYNGEAYLAEALESALAQTEKNIEVVVVDDGSTDSSREILRGFALQDSRVRVFGEEHRGLVPTLNRGLEVARGKYICRLDADDIALSDRVEKQVAFLEANPDHVLVGGQVILIGKYGEEIGMRYQPVSHTALATEFKRFNCFTHSSVMFRKDEAISLGGYDPAFDAAEDYDLWVRMSARNRLANLSDVVCKYREHGNQISSSKIVGQAFVMMCVRAGLRGANRELIRETVQIHVTDYPEAMRHMGFSDDEIAEGIFGRYIHWVGMMRSFGRREDAMELLGEATQLMLEWKSPARYLAHLYRLEFLLALDVRDYRRAAGYLARAFVMSPRDTSERILSKVHRVFSGKQDAANGARMNPISQ